MQDRSAPAAANDSVTALAELAGGFIHELKNHLGTLGLNLQLLAEDFQDAPSTRERRALTRVQKLQSECQRLVEVANDFLRFARIHELELRPSNVDKILEEMIDFFSPTAKAGKIEIRPFISADLPPVLLDRELFKQALLNLLLNAEQAMPGGGELTILAIPESRARSAERGVRGVERPDSAPPRALRASHVSISFIDTGKGMEPEVLPKIFKPFFTTRAQGSGLGLPTVKKIVEAHGGTIEVQSEPGKGTKFTIRLPACED